MKVYSYDENTHTVTEYEGDFGLEKGSCVFVDQRVGAVKSWIYLYASAEAAFEGWKERRSKILAERVLDTRRDVASAERELAAIAAKGERPFRRDKAR